MNKKELIDAVSTKTGFAKTNIKEVSDVIFGSITDALANGEKVQITGFGNFEAVEVAERTARNPQTGDPIKVAAHKRVKFKAAKALKDSVNL